MHKARLKALEMSGAQMFTVESVSRNDQQVFNVNKAWLQLDFCLKPDCGIRR